MTEENDINEYEDILNSLNKINSESLYLSENPLSVVTDWIDTDCFALNAILSGSFYKGIPVGRIIGMSGPSGCGKTLILTKILANAQKRGIYPVVWESEHAFDINMAENLGCDASKIKICPVETIEDCRNQMVKFLDNIIEKKKYGKFILALDSLGNLSTKKELNDASEGKDSSDMGFRAKICKSMMRCLTYKCAKAKVSLIFTNHIYADPSVMYESLIKKQGGGFGPEYLASILVQMAKIPEKINDNKNEEFIAIANKVSGTTLKLMTTKNRFIPPYLTVDLYLNFKTGLFKYSGLLAMAEMYNIIKRTGPIYIITETNEKLGYYSEWKNKDDVWKTIINKLEPIINKDFLYSKVS